MVGASLGLCGEVQAFPRQLRVVPPDSRRTVRPQLGNAFRVVS